MPKLNPKQELFCLYYATNEVGTFGNATQSYLKAYKDESSNIPTEESAAVSGFRQLRKAKILDRIKEYWKKSGLTDEEVDAHLAMIVRQSADLANKLGGIREYNKVKQRGAENVNLHLVKPLPVEQANEDLQNLFGIKETTNEQNHTG